MTAGAAEQGRLRQLVSFRLADEEYGVEITKVQEIIRMQEITRVPQMPGFLEGVINLRGNVIPVIDLRKRFGMPAKDRDGETRIVVVNVEGRTIGVVVDSVAEVLRISSDQIEPPPSVVAGIGREYLLGVGKLAENRLLILLDLEKVLSGREKAALTDVKGVD